MVPEGLVLLTSVAFAIGVIRLGRKQCLVQELPAIEGLARVDIVCLDKTGTLTEGGMDVTELRPLDGADEAYVRAGARRARRSPTRGPTPASRRSSTPTRTARTGAAPAVAAVLLRPQVQRRCAAFGEGDGESSTWLLGAPDVLLPAGDPALAETERLNEQGLRVLLLARAAGRRWTTPTSRAGAEPDRPRRPGAAAAPGRRRHPALLRRAGRRAKVISGDNAVSVGAVAGKLGLPGAERRPRRPQLPADPDGHGRRRSTRTRSSAGSPRSRSGTWSAPCSPAATRSR